MYKPKLYKSHKEIKDVQDRINHVKEDNKYYPTFHLAPKFGLLNDPNGLVYYNNEYHIFYQYHPNDVAHGLKNWYHLTTKDFIKYTDYGIKLFPEYDFENYGIFSGVARVEDEKVYLYYTGNHRDENDNYTRKPVQCIAKMDSNYNIISKEVFLPHNEKYSEHYRDPFVCKNGDILLGAQTPSGQGCLSLVQKNLQEHTIYMDNELKDCYMLECPNVLETENGDILICSTQGLNNDKYQNIHSVIYMEFDRFANSLDGEPKLLDYGFDFYAPHVFDDGNRKIMIPWIGQAETIYPLDRELGWSQILGMPRKIEYKDGKLIQNPIAEVEKTFGEKKLLMNNDGIDRSFKISGNLKNGEKIIIDNGLEFSMKDFTFFVDRSNCDFKIEPNFGDLREVKLNKKTVYFEIYVDCSVFEIYLNHGEITLSGRFFQEKIEKIDISDIEEIYYQKVINKHCIS